MWESETESTALASGAFVTEASEATELGGGYNVVPVSFIVTILLPRRLTSLDLYIISVGSTVLFFLVLVCVFGGHGRDQKAQDSKVENQ